MEVEREGTLASIWFLTMPMNASISRKIGRFWGQQGSIVVTAESNICATSAGGSCLSVHVYRSRVGIRIKHDNVGKMSEMR